MSFYIGNFSIPIGVLTDSYKSTHFEMYPECNRMVAYGEFRQSFEKNKEDQRILFYGIRYLVQSFLEKQWTMEDVNKCEQFYNTHNAGFTKFPFPKDLFVKFINENNGYFPIKVEALPEGTVCYVHTPVYQITSVGVYSRLCTFFETLLTQVWYPSTVATLSRMAKDYIEEAFHKSVDESNFWLLESRLHDFGFRGCTSVEQSILGGSAHLLNFSGSDTMSACYYIQFHLNNGKPIGTSIPATEHSVMTAWRTEKEAILNVIQKYGGGVFATVMDSYDYQRALDVVVPSVAQVKKEKGGLWVLRPDSGDPIEAVLMALRAGEKTFGTTTNRKGYKIINGAATIQGDGINIHTIPQILDAALKEGYSAENIAYGMGGGLLQKVNRDTMGFATKLNFIEYADGTQRDVMKNPKTDLSKVSLPGILRVKRGSNGLPTVLPRDPNDDSYEADDLLRPVYDCKPLPGVWEDYNVIRARAQTEWNKAPKLYNVISPQLKEKIQLCVHNLQLSLSQ